MIAEVTISADVSIDIDEAFNSLSYMEQAECVSNFYDWLQKSQKKQFIAEIIEDADDDTLIGELERRGYNIKKRRVTYESQNKKKRSTLPVVVSVRSLNSDLSFLGDIQLPPFMRMGSKVLWFFRKSNNSKTKTMETTKEEMIQFLRELQDLQMCLYDSLHEITLDINLYVFENSTAIYGYVSLFSDIVGMSKSISIHSIISYEQNRTQLNYFVEYAKKLSKYGNRKSESNQTPT